MIKGDKTRSRDSSSYLALLEILTKDKSLPGPPMMVPRKILISSGKKVKGKQSPIRIPAFVVGTSRKLNEVRILVDNVEDPFSYLVFLGLLKKPKRDQQTRLCIWLP